MSRANTCVRKSLLKTVEAYMRKWFLSGNFPPEITKKCPCILKWDALQPNLSSSFQNDKVHISRYASLDYIPPPFHYGPGCFPIKKVIHRLCFLISKNVDCIRELRRSWFYHATIRKSRFTTRHMVFSLLNFPLAGDISYPVSVWSESWIKFIEIFLDKKASVW